MLKDICFVIWRWFIFFLPMLAFFGTFALISKIEAYFNIAVSWLSGLINLLIIAVVTFIAVVLSCALH